MSSVFKYAKFNLYIIDESRLMIDEYMKVIWTLIFY